MFIYPYTKNYNQLKANVEKECCTKAKPYTAPPARAAWHLSKKRLSG
jgi:hypothetical protein